MFYFDDFYGRKVLKSDLLADVFHFFSTREEFECDKLNAKRFIMPVQTHSDNIEYVDKKDVYDSTDGLILTNSEDAIALKFADCTPLIFYDRRQKIGAISHAGWKGTVAKIGVKTIKKMRSKPEDVIAVIGPAISICCYEVGEDVKKQLLETINNSAGLYDGNKVSLKHINARQLEEIGVKQIDICPYCTSCDNDLFYSYRKENGTMSRHKAVLKLSC